MIMTMMKKLGFIFLLFLLLSACEDDTRIPTEAGVVIFAAPPDNCNDFIIETAGGTRLKPSNLRNDFQVDQLQIIFGYEITSDFHDCGFAGAIPIINITTIRRR